MNWSDVEKRFEILWHDTDELWDEESYKQLKAFIAKELQTAKEDTLMAVEKLAKKDKSVFKTPYRWFYEEHWQKLKKDLLSK